MNFKFPLLINIHTHLPELNGHFSIQNLHALFSKTDPMCFYSMGLHPCYLNEKEWRNELNLLRLYSTASNVLAIGECGLDRICSTSFKWQEEVFRHQISWANEIAKPIIVHCVRAHRETLAILKEMKNIMPVIFHGFNNNENIAKQITDAGYYLSFGKALFNPSTEKVFTTIANDHIFLETDECDMGIEMIYRKACTIKNINMDALSLQVKRNAKKVININL